MNPINFTEAHTVYAPDQPEYRALPAHRSNDASGVATTCWKLSAMERLKLLVTGRVWVQQMTFNDPLQPQLVSADKPEL